MANNGTIDPEMQAAPILGGTSFDPVEFARRQHAEKVQRQKVEYYQKEKETAAGLQNLMVDLKGWEDQAGFKELMDDQNKVLNGFMALSRKGANLINPKTAEEITAYKAINDAHNAIKQKADTWMQQKQIYDLTQKAIEEDSKKPQEEQEIDHEKTQANLQNALKDNSILSRAGKLTNLIVTKPSIGDVQKYLTSIKDRIPKPDVIATPMTDPDTGQTINRQEIKVTPEKEKEIISALRTQYKYAPVNVKEAVKRQGELNKGNEPQGFTDEDRFVAMGYPAYQEKFVDKAVGTGGGIKFMFGSQKQSIQPGTPANEDRGYGTRIYKDRYEFPTPTKPTIINLNSTQASMYSGRANMKTGADGWEPIRPGDSGDVEANLVFYDPQRDELVFRTTQTNPDPYTGNNTTVAVPRKSVNGADDLPIMVNGKMKKLKDLLPEDKKGTDKKLIGGQDLSTPALLKRPK